MQFDMSRSLGDHSSLETDVWVVGQVWWSHVQIIIRGCVLVAPVGHRRADALKGERSLQVGWLMSPSAVERSSFRSNAAANRRRRVGSGRLGGGAAGAERAGQVSWQIMPLIDDRINGRPSRRNGISVTTEMRRIWRRWVGCRCRHC